MINPYVSRMIRTKKGTPTATEVHRRGTNTRREGSFWALQLTARIAAPGMSQRMAKPVRSSEGEKSRRAAPRAQTRKGRAAGRLTTSTQALIHRERPKPPGFTRAPRKNWIRATTLPKRRAHTSPEPPFSGDTDRQNR
jgi:hypothetical protein